MPPKPKPAAPSKKTVEKKKEKVIEDKTFGLKNKKGAKQQRFIQQVEKQVKTGGVPARKLGEDPKKDKDAKLKEQKELGLLFRPIQQKVEKGADRKSVICAFFKQGQCGKGNKCKFSHDLTVERKAAKRSLYVDMRDEDEEDTMENWDEEKLKEVVEKKHGESEKKMPTTDIICKFFLDAVEKSKYGWFWQCPNGESCIYKHALPPGFILKKDRKKEDKKDEISLEELIEKERASLSASGKFTKVTLDSFLSWKKRKVKEKKDAATKDEEKKRIDYKAGRQHGLSGREMFFFNPDLAAADLMDEGDEAIDSYAREGDEDEEEIQYRDIELEILALEAQEADNTGTVAPDDRLNNGLENGVSSSSESPSEEGATAAVPINENLFLDDDLEDLQDELDELALDQ